MEHLTEYHHPKLRDPVLLVAFAGWNDAAEVATGAVRYLIRRWNAELCAEIDPEDFFVFTETRPQVRIVDSIQRRIIWPQTQFFSAQLPNCSRDALILLGSEPQIHWKTFIKLVLDYATSYGVDVVVALGGLVADVLHSRPPVLTGSISDPALARRLAGMGLQRSGYEGPTGILGVLGSACRERGIVNGSIWGNVPHYVASTVNPVISVALLQRVSAMFDFPIDLTEIERSAARFKAQVEEAIASDAEVASYVRQLEERERSSELDPPSESETASPPVELPNPETVVQELEEFFRQRKRDSDV
ncbi:MAG TPA: PAC2 family protein [Chloroflexota bacterium]|jgi:proteasome assembly chaperone (PAC2) family protein|nr:PAC2 family protein [Chloroflexota bacterium]